MLAGPGLIGGLAEVFGLPEALGVIVLLSVLAMILAGVTRPRASNAANAPPPVVEAGTR
jgi:hypothetical protein